MEVNMNALSPWSSRRGFTFVELLVAVVILGLILASVVPFIMANREMSRRIECVSRLTAIHFAMSQYRQDFVAPSSASSYPRTKHDPSKTAWTAYTGADDSNPFAPDSKVEANDVTASLWLLVRIGYLPDTSVFVCPSSDRRADLLTNAIGQRVEPSMRGNFRSGRNLAYSILSPFNTNANATWTDTLPSSTALLADMSPGIEGEGDDVTKPLSTDPPEVQRLANSNNHAKVGQNVLYPGGNVDFVSHAFVGVSYVAPHSIDQQTRKPIPPRMGDNIYTSLVPRPNIPDGPTLSSGPGAFGRDVGPSWNYDSYLVPSDDD
jgi:prepilin-type N-terminal cleavage/methylation domain-containing protein